MPALIIKLYSLIALFHSICLAWDQVPYLRPWLSLFQALPYHTIDEEVDATTHCHGGSTGSTVYY